MYTNFYYKKDRLNQLRGFCTTVQCGSTKQASLKLNLEQPAVSKQIKALERDLKIKLFERNGYKSLILTEDGQKLYDRTIPIIEAVDNLYQDFSEDIQSAKVKSIKIAAHHSFLSDILPKYLRKLLDNKSYKDINIKLYNIGKDEALDKLVSGEIDIAIYQRKKMDSITPFGLKRVDLFKFENMLMMHKDHPLANRESIDTLELVNYPYLFLDKYMSYHPKENFDLTPSQITFENGNWNIVKGLIRENLGMTFILKNHYNEKSLGGESLTIKNVEHISLKSYFSIYTKKNSVPKGAVSFLLKLMEKDKNI